MKRGAAVVMAAAIILGGSATPADAATWTNSWHKYVKRWHAKCHVETSVGAALGYTVIEKRRVCGSTVTVLSQQFIPNTDSY
jgi:hypothetical protein